MDDTKPMIYVLDDEPTVGMALHLLIRSVGLAVQTFTSAQEFLNAKLPDVPGCLVLDVRLPDLNGLELQQKLLQAGINLPVVFITGHGDIPMSVRAMKAGAVEFLTKPFNDQALLDAIQTGVERHRAARFHHAELADTKRAVDSLTPRQKEVFLLVVRGLLNKQIATELNLSEKTVKSHRAHVMHKTKAGSLPDLVRMAEKLQLGLS
jgi:FixJ family two-component response regulator